MQRYFAKNKEDKLFTLEESDYHHIKNVMRMKENETIEVVFDHTLYLACIQNVKGKMEIREEKLVQKEEMSDKKITLFLPFLKEQKLDFILQKSAELGVYKLVFIPLERSIIKVKEKKEVKLSRWKKIVKEASEQSKRLSIPLIDSIESLEEMKELEGLNLICSTQNNLESIKKVVKKNSECDRINVVIGPEGGLSPKEENQLMTYGFLPITLGKRIMRVETVPLYILSVINYEFME